MGAFVTPAIIGAAGVAAAGHHVSKSIGRRLKYEPPTPAPSPTVSPSPRTVMAAERAELDHHARKKRRLAGAMGGDYGALMTSSERLGT